jgi:hypothetical protein
MEHVTYHILDKNVQSRLWRPVIIQHVRNSVLKHPTVSSCVHYDIVNMPGIQAHLCSQTHRLGGGGDVNSGQELINHLNIAGSTNTTRDEVQLLRQLLQELVSSIQGGRRSGREDCEGSICGPDGASGDGAVD